MDVISRGNNQTVGGATPQTNSPPKTVLSQISTGSQVGNANTINSPPKGNVQPNLNSSPSKPNGFNSFTSRPPQGQQQTPPQFSQQYQHPSQHHLQPQHIPPQPQQQQTHQFPQQHQQQRQVNQASPQQHLQPSPLTVQSGFKANTQQQQPPTSMSSPQTTSNEAQILQAELVEVREYYCGLLIPIRPWI